MEHKVGRYTIEITNPDKILFPKTRITKAQLVNYYYRIAPLMVPHVKNHPVTMDRFPQGIDHETFYQKDAPEYFPSFIKRQAVKKNDGGIVHYPLITKDADIVYLANYVCVPHIWLSRVPKLNYPDRMIFDLDPSPGVSFSQVKWAAVIIKKLLEQVGLPPFVMTTGSYGLHVVVPLKPTMLFDEVRQIAFEIAQCLVERYPDKLTLEVRKSVREKRVFIDTLRNAWSATSVVPYGVRALEGAPIATPITWAELARLSSSQHYTIATIFQRIARRGDIWKDMNRAASTLTKVPARLQTVLKNRLLADAL
jgi:bifunctional non-homologous end joining protein LigD